MKRIIYDYENPHLVGRAKRSFSIIKLIIAIVVVSLALALIYVLFIRDSSYSCQSKNYFMLVYGRYADQKSASDAAAALASRGGGGYVDKDDGYEVIVSIYTSKSDALAVANRYGWQIKDIGVFTVKKELTQRALSQKAASFCTFPEQIIDELYELTISLDSGDISEDAAQLGVSRLLSKVQGKLDEYESFAAADKQHKSVEEMYGSICGQLVLGDGIATTAALKRSLIGVTICYRDFLSAA